MADMEAPRDVDEILIVEVQKHKCLYDVNRCDYKDQLKKANAWKAVAAAMNWEGGLTNTYRPLCFYDMAQRFPSPHVLWWGSQ